METGNVMTIEVGGPRGSVAGEPHLEPGKSLAEAALTAPEEIFDLVLRQVRKLAGRRDDVEELTQAAIEQVLRSLSSFEGRSRLSTWTFRVCSSTIHKHDRRHRRWRRRFALTVDGELPEAVVNEPGGEGQLATMERLGRLQAALDLISAKRRAAVVMHDLEELSIDEIARILGAAPVAVRSRLRGARKALAAVLASDPYFSAEAFEKKGKIR
jgi:RNA polymerase sigma factor (sigma-70 family)